MTSETIKRTLNPGVYSRVCRGKPWAGLFLYRMAWQLPKATTVIDGKLWYVHSRKQTITYWGCSKRQYDKAIAFLRGEGLIETCYAAAVGGNQSLRNTAFRLTDRAMARIEFEAGRGRREQLDDVTVEWMSEEPSLT